jgi:hypothetical protein
MIKKFKDLTIDEIQHICNGCGGKGGWLKPPNFIFKSSCNHHDYNYYLGFKESHRKKADKQFYRAMKDQIKKVNFFRRPGLHIAAYSYYTAVRWCGADYFHYGKK